MQYFTNTESEDVKYITLPWWVNGGGSSKISVASPIPESREFVPYSVDRYRTEPEEEVSFKKVKQERLIKMTPLSAGEVTTTNFVAYRERSKRSFVNWANDRCPETWVSGEHELHTVYREFFDYDRVATEWLIPHYRYEVPDISDVLASVKADAVSDLQVTFDALTEFKEFPDVIRLFTKIVGGLKEPIKGIKSLQKRYNKARKKGKTHREALGDLSNEWLQYRYAIMPLVFSVQDIVELLDSRTAEFKTGRSRDSVQLKGDSAPLFGGESGFIYDEVTGTIKCSAVGKSRFTDQSLRLADQISINPFLTAWELIPFSFVIDWFVNVGDVILANTSTWLSLASQSAFCASVKQEYTLLSKFRGSLTDSYVITGSDYVSCDGSVSRPAFHYEKHDLSEWDVPIRMQTFRTYDRTLYNPRDTSLSFNPSLSWMRSLDLAALSLKQALRRLK